MTDDKENDIIPLDDWKARRAEQYAEAQKELAKKLRESYKLANTMWRLADDLTDIKTTRTLQAVIHWLELLISR